MNCPPDPTRVPSTPADDPGSPPSTDSEEEVRVRNAAWEAATRDLIEHGDAEPDAEDDRDSDGEGES